MIHSCRTLPSWLRRSTKTQRFVLLTPSTAAIAASFRNTREASASGPSSVSSSSARASGHEAHSVVAALLGFFFCVFDSLRERFFERNSKSPRQKLRGAIAGNDHFVFTPQPKLTRNVNSRLIRKGHPGFKHSLASPNQIRMLVSIQSDPVSEPVREKLVVGAEARIRDNLARGVIHGARQTPNACRVERGILRLAHDFECPRHFFRWLAEDSRACHVRLVTFHCAAAVDQHHVALFQLLRLDAAVRQRRRCPQQDQRSAVQIHFRKARLHQLADAFLRHAFLERGARGTRSSLGRRKRIRIPAPRRAYARKT